MCVNCRTVYNPYTRQKLVVECGKCPSCLQKKAAKRASIIRYNSRPDDGTICLFVTLTYDRFSVPYVKLSEIKGLVNGGSVNVYRKQSVRLVRASKGNCYKQKLRHIFQENVISSFYFSSQDDDFLNGVLPLKKDSSDHIGVCFYQDLQYFFSRLRLFLKRNYNINTKFSYYACSEYGGSSLRPHFHTLLFIPKVYEECFRCAVVKAWPFAARSRQVLGIEVARDPAGYVASYVSKPSGFPKVLEEPHFRPKNSYSKHFGFALHIFQLPSILEQIRKGCLSYNVSRIEDGVLKVVSVPIPKRVINRFFPLFKGYSRISDSSLLHCLVRPERLREFHEIGYVESDFHSITVRLNNAYAYYYSQTGKTRFDFALDFLSCWRVYRSTVLRLWYLSVLDDSQWVYQYDNLNEVDFNDDLKRYLDFEIPLDFDFDVNKNPYRVAETLRLQSVYDSYTKYKLVMNTLMTESGFNV